MSLFCVCSLIAAVGCKARIPEPEPVKPSAAAPVVPPAAASTPSSTPEPLEPAQPKEGWREVTVENTLPLCVFANASERANAKSVEQVQRQVLGADRPVTFGVFGPPCMNPKCDEQKTLQCSVERSGNNLRLQTRYVGFHNDGATCSDACRQETAGCESPVLEPGEYTLEYGPNQIPLKIPSALNKPCFTRR
ncbi:MAG TPA: hypothetical protein VFN67_26795 [Polyangiales bacterium]|nr:hypothetical protein [Polyangiales bacterium]